MKKAKWENIIMLFGILLLACATGLALFYTWEGNRAGEYSRKLLKQARQEFSEENVMQQEASGRRKETSEEQAEEVWAILEIPSLDLELPVMGSYSEELLKQAVCRYDENIIAGHSYKQHFRGLRKVQKGAIVTLEFPEEKQQYIVSEIIEIEGTDSEGLFEGAWDLSLFTCNFSGSKRVVVRCIRQ